MRDRYPVDWPAISLTVREAAGWQCECVGECGRKHFPDVRCSARQGQPAPRTGSVVVLTTAHLDHVPEHVDRGNLRAFCQSCHLAYDREHHAQTRRATRDAAQGQGDLW
jgi:hypothetical protein